MVCLQEVLTQQIEDIAAGLNGEGSGSSSKRGDASCGGSGGGGGGKGECEAEWRWKGVARDDGKDKGERCVILFRRGEWEEVHFETVWLNEDGAVGRRGWDAGSVRVVSCLVLDAVAGPGEQGEDNGEDEGGRKRRRRRVLVMNTHLDNAGRVARAKSAEILLRVAHRLTSQWNVDFWVIAGDLNSEEDGEAYQILQHSVEGKEEVRVRDAMKCIPDEQRKRRYGEHYTYTGFDGKGDEDGKVQRIDFVFVGGKDEKEGKSVEGCVRGYAVMPNGWEDGGEGRMSDHRAVCVDLVI